MHFALSDLCYISHQSLQSVHLILRESQIMKLLNLSPRGELSYLAPLGSQIISAPYFKQCFFRVGVITLLFDRVGVFMTDIIFTLLSLLLCL
jgi:hypothetical protein